MLNKIKKNMLIIVCFSALLFSSCGPSDPVDKQLNNLEKVISKYEKKAGKSKLTQMDLQTMTTELEAIGTETPAHITSAQEQRFLALGKREECLNIMQMLLNNKSSLLISSGHYQSHPIVLNTLKIAFTPIKLLI